MAKKAPNTAKCVVWTERSRAEMEGPSKAICYHLFQMVPAEQRDELLKDMETFHKRGWQA
jgi:hypothetical protein